MRKFSFVPVLAFVGAVALVFAGLGVNTAQAQYVKKSGDTVSWSGPYYFYITSTNPTAFRAYSSSTSAKAVYGYATSGSGATYGGYFLSKSTAGRAVYGYATAGIGSTYGGYFQSASTSGRGVFGYASATSGTTYGGYFQSNSTAGRALYGYVPASSGTTYGGYFRTDSSAGRALYACALATSGYTLGGYFVSASPQGIGLGGEASAASGYTAGGYFRSSSTNGVAVYGEATAPSGDTCGGRFVSSSSSTDAKAVYASAEAMDGGPTALYAHCAAPDGWAARFHGGQGVRVDGGLEVTGTASVGGDHLEVNNLQVGNDILVAQDAFVNRDLYVQGSKNFVQRHPTDPTKEIVYTCLEGPEAGTYIRGTGQLASGEAVIELPEHFALVTGEAALTATVTPVGEWLQLYVAECTPGKLVVREASEKSGTFNYLVQGIRKGYENHEVIRPAVERQTAKAAPAKLEKLREKVRARPRAE